VFFNLHNSNSYLLQGHEQRSRHSGDPTSGHGEDVLHGEAYNDGNKNCEMTTDV
jgi:hypothetical protein